MAKRVSFPVPETGEADLNVDFEVSIDLPPDLSHGNDRLSVLVYPVQVGFVSNWPVPRLVDLVGDENRPAWPRINEMPGNGIFFWILHGSVAVDYRTVPAQGRWFNREEYAYLAPSVAGSENGAKPHPEPFGPGDKMGGAWDNADMWGRLIPVAESDGTLANEPQYLMVYGFAGKEGAPRELLDEMIDSLEVLY